MSGLVVHVGGRAAAPAPALPHPPTKAVLGLSRPLQLSKDLDLRGLPVGFETGRASSAAPWTRPAPAAAAAAAAAAPAAAVAPPAQSTGLLARQPQGQQQQLEFVPSTRGGRAGKRQDLGRPRSLVRPRSAALATTETVKEGIAPGLRSDAAPAATAQQVPISVQIGNEAQRREPRQELVHQEQVQELVSSNTRMVSYLAHRFRGLGLPYEDLVGEGLAALEASARSYDPGLGVRFSSYSWAVISRRLQSAAQQYSRPLRVPRAKWSLMHQERAAREDLEQHLGRAPTLREVAERLGATEAELLALRRFRLSFTPALGPVLPSDQAAGAGASSPLALADLVADEQQSEGDLSCLALEATVGELLEYLPPRQRLAVELCFGLGGRQELRAAEVARAMQVSPVTAKLLLSQALRTLRALAQ